MYEIFNNRPATLIKKRLWHRYVPVKFVKFLMTTFFTEYFRWLLLEILKTIKMQGSIGTKWTKFRFRFKLQSILLQCPTFYFNVLVFYGNGNFAECKKSRHISIQLIFFSTDLDQHASCFSIQAIDFQEECSCDLI